MSERIINLMVESVTVDAVETTMLGDTEPDITRGRTTVLFRMADGQAFDIDWTWRGDPPTPGTKWTLAAT